MQLKALRTSLHVKLLANRQLRRFVTKTLLVMKLTIILLTATAMHVCANASSQTVNFSGKDVPLEKIFSIVKDQTGYVFFFDMAVLDGSKPVTISVKNEPMHSFLHKILQTQSLDYSIKKKTVFIRKIPIVVKAVGAANAIVDSVLEAPYYTVTGKVVTDDGVALAGATITNKNSKQSVPSGSSGTFSINANDGDVLAISHVGYLKVEVRLSSSNSAVVAFVEKSSAAADAEKESTAMRVGQTVPFEGGGFTIRLAKVLSQLDEVQVIAYGTTTRRLSTSNISSVKGDVLSKSPVLNPLQAMQGRVPGITIESSSGLPGADINVRIQGQNSITRGNNPLYIVDGIPYPSDNLRNQSWILGRTEQTKNGENNYGGYNPGSPMRFINMNDIESIEVLKDADATAIYGSRGANGVILITTKKGKAGPIKFDLNLQQGLAEVSRKMKLLNTQEYLEMRREAYRNSGLAVPDKNSLQEPSNYDLTFWDENKYTDWQEKLIGGTAKYTNLYASASGGTDNMQYLIGTTYSRQTSVFPVDFATQSAGVNMNLNLASDNKKFRSEISAQYFFNNNVNPNGGDLTRYIYRAPNAPDLKNPDGTLNWAPLPNGVSSNSNPLCEYESRLRNNVSNLISNANISFEIISGLVLKSTFGFNQLQGEELLTTPLTSYTPEVLPYEVRRTAVVNARTTTWQVEPQLTYSKSIARGKLNVLLGTTFSENYQYSQHMSGWGGTNDLLLEDISSHPNVRANAVIAPKYKYSAGFARINYVWRDKYVVNLNGRRDGSSRFGSANILHNFGSIAGAWLFSNEGFIKSALPFLSFGKFHGSYGTIGNDNIGNYSQLSLYRVTGNGVDKPYQGTIALGPVGLPNPNLQWEEIQKLSLGLDLGFFNDRLLINTIWYRNRSSNQLMGYDLPRTTGFYNIDRNFPAEIQNTGWEFTLQSVNIDGKNWKWTTDANLTIQRNKLLAFPGIESTGYRNRLTVGKPLNIERYYHYLGVDPETGLYTFADQHGTPTYSPVEADKTVYRSAFPIFTAGMTNTISYKNFQLDFVLQIVKQYGVNLRQGANPGGMTNQPSFVLDRWQKPGDKASIQKYSVTYEGNEGNAYNSYGGSDAGYGDASFVRLNNMTVSWTLPESFIKSIRLKNARVFMLGQNLFVLTPYKGIDPEQRNGFYSSLPPLRVVTFGLQLTF